MGTVGGDQDGDVVGDWVNKRSEGVAVSGVVCVEGVEEGVK
jgi:hypothetical protein